MPDQPVSIITGAGSGIGLAAARQLSEMGHHVVLVGRREAVLNEAVPPNWPHVLFVGHEASRFTKYNQEQYTIQRRIFENFFPR